MVSLVVCSRKKILDKAFIENINVTIGCEYELINIDNSDNSYSIFEAYNIGIKKSKYKLIGFIHDDIKFHTSNWGKTLMKIFNQDEKIGLLGVAGAKVKTKAPSGWWSCPEEYKAIYILQHVNNSVEKWNFGEDNFVIEVAVIDGVFMVARKTPELYFDEQLLGFHNYDLFLSSLVKKSNKKIVITKDILIEHFSIGVVNFDWFIKALNFHKLYKNSLPIYVDYDKQKIQKLEVANSQRFIKNYTFYKTDFQIMKYWFSFFLRNPFQKFHINHLFLLSYNLYKKYVK